MRKLLLLTAFCCTALYAWAISPNPQMNFYFDFPNGTALAVDALRSEQIQCADSLCLSAKPLGDYGAQRLTCSAGSCRSVAYEYEPYQKLVIAFSDGSVRESGVFAAPKALHTAFNVSVGPDTLIVTPAAAPTDAVWERADAWQALALILILELLAAAAYLRYKRKSLRILYGVALANLLTTAVSWYWLARYVTGGFLLWIFCLVAEAFIIKLCHARRITLNDSFVLSLMINITSYTLGMIIAFSLSQL